MPNTIRTEPKAFKLAKELRHNTTPSERKLWAALRADQLGVSIRRQHAIGPYITDFCCIKRKLVIELDGGHHLDQVEYDARRTAYLASRGYRVIRFWNRDVKKNLSGVVARILEELECAPLAAPSPHFLENGGN